MPQDASGNVVIDGADVKKGWDAQGYKPPNDPSYFYKVSAGEAPEGVNPAQDKGVTPEQKSSSSDKGLEKELSESGRVISRLGKENKVTSSLAEAALSALGDIEPSRLRQLLEEDENLLQAFKSKFPEKYAKIFESEESPETENNSVPFVQSEEGQRLKKELPFVPPANEDALTERLIAKLASKQIEHEQRDTARQFAQTHGLNEDQVDDLYKEAKALASVSKSISFEKALYGVFQAKKGETPESAPLVPRSINLPTGEQVPADEEERIQQMMSYAGYERPLAEKVIRAARNSLSGMTTDGGKGYNVSLSN